MRPADSFFPSNNDKTIGPFRHDSAAFPQNSTGNGNFRIASNIAQNMYVDFGDGSTVQTVAITAGGAGVTIPRYTYSPEWGDGVRKEVYVSFDFPRQVYRMDNVNCRLQDEYANIGALQGLQDLRLQEPASTSLSKTLTFHPGVYNIRTLTSIEIVFFFDSSSTAFTSIPLEIVRKESLSKLRYLGLGLNDVPIEQTNVEKLVENPTLSDVEVTTIEKIPVEWNTGLNLTRHSLLNNATSGGGIAWVNGTNGYTSLNLFVQAQSNITEVDYRGCGFDSWPDFSNRSFLANIRVSLNPILSDVWPPSLSTLSSLATLDIASIYLTQSRAENFIGTLWDEIIGNSIPLTGSGPLRNIVLTTGSNFVVTPVQPAGYVQGSSNGTVTTVQEKLYCIINQYNITGWPS